MPSRSKGGLPMRSVVNVVVAICVIGHRSASGRIGFDIIASKPRSRLEAETDSSGG